MSENVEFMVIINRQLTVAEVFATEAHLSLGSRHEVRHVEALWHVCLDLSGYLDISLILTAGSLLV